MMQNNGQWYGIILSIQELQADFIAGRKYVTVAIIIALTTSPRFVDFSLIWDTVRIAGKLQLATLPVSFSSSKQVVTDLWCPDKWLLLQSICAYKIGYNVCQKPKFTFFCPDNRTYPEARTRVRRWSVSLARHQVYGISLHVLSILIH